VGFDQYHEPANELSEEVRTFARMIVSLTEETEAINWYEQRISVEKDAEARAIMPSFATRPIPVTRAGRTLVDGIESRAATVAAPGWIRPLLPLRGLAGPLMDEFMVANPGLSRAISRAERKQNVK